MSESDPKKPEIVSLPGSRDPSYPDRQRIDSDVRAFLREPSTPWIVFDKDSRVDREELRRSYLSAGAFILQSGRSSVVSAQDFASAPSAAAPLVSDAASDTRVEPSGLSVASDIDVPEASPTVRPMSIDIEVDEPEEPKLPISRRAKHTTWLAIASGATLFVVAGVLALGSRAPAGDVKAAAAVHAPVTTVAPSRAAEEVPPPEPAAVVSTPAPSEDAKPAEVKVAKKAEKADVKHSKFGRLVISGEARYKNVFFDGKRMLGKGTRSFAVLCGTHTIAVADKSDAREIEIPCDGEYAVQR